MVSEKMLFFVFQEPDEEKSQQAAAQAMNEAMKKALARVDASKLPLVQPLIDKSWEIYAKSVALGIDLDAQREKEKEKKAAKEKAKGGAQAESKTEEGKDDSQEEPGLKTHALVMWGNVIFEQVPNAFTHLSSANSMILCRVRFWQRQAEIGTLPLRRPFLNSERLDAMRRISIKH